MKQIPQKRHASCNGTNHKLCKYECDWCFSKSFASSKRAKHWSPSNGDVNPRDVYLHSNTTYNFICPNPKCKHEFNMMLNSVSRCWCPFCSEPAKKLCCKEDCDACLKRSFASSDKAKHWSPTNDVKPRDVFLSARKKHKFICDVPECKHEFEISLSHISGHWCPFCQNQKLCENPKCKMCSDKSFASSNRSKYWSPKNSFSPRSVFLCSHKKCKFICESGHRFSAILGNITCNRQWCPHCKNKTEKKLYEFLLTIFSKHMVKKGYRADWCINPETGKHLPFDFLLVFLNVIIELDGPHHFVQVSNWTSPEQTRRRDSYKEARARENGKTVIRLLQTDVLNDRNDWQTHLLRCLNYIFESPVTVYLYGGVERIPTILVFVND